MSTPDRTTYPAVVVHLPPGDESLVRRLLHALPAWIFISVVHALLLALFLLVNYDSPSAGINAEPAIINNLADEPADESLTVLDLGSDATRETNFPVDRIEPVSIPGQVTLDEL